jgi:hypothetical protein
MRRIVVLMTVVVLMMGMLVGGASSAVFAHDVSCTGNNPGLLFPEQTATNPAAQAKDRDGDGFVCSYTNQNTGVTHYRDDHEAP